MKIDYFNRRLKRGIILDTNKDTAVAFVYDDKHDRNTYRAVAFWPAKTAWNWLGDETQEMSFPSAVPSLQTDAAPPVSSDTPIIFLAGAIKYWWGYRCDLCGQYLGEDPEARCNSGIHQGPDDANSFRGRAVEIWGSHDHQRYVKWRNDVRAALIDAGYLTYAPHEAFKGTWTERAQAVNDAGIRAATVMLVLSPLGIPTEGTDDEVGLAQHVGTPVFFAPPSMGLEAFLETFEGFLNSVGRP